MKSKVDTCIFCDEAPCVCNAKPKKAAPPKKKAEPAPKPDILDGAGDVPSGAKTSSFLAAMKRAAAESPPPPPMPPPPIPEKKTPKKVPTVPDEELVFNAAIRNLAPLLHPDELERYGGIISSQPHLGERTAIWKFRRKHNGDDLSCDGGDT